jgi:predicted dehydrogenase
MKRIRLGIVGCGDIAQIMHLPFLTELKDYFEVRAACDILPEMVETVADAFHVPARCTDYTELVARDDIDAVAVLNHDHAPVVLAAAQAGKHVFVEKPMCYTAAEGQAIRQVIAERDLVLLVAYMKRYDPGYEYARELIRALPGVHLVRVHDFAGMLTPDDIYTLYRPGAGAAEIRAQGQAAVQVKLAAGLGTSQPELVTAYGLMLGLASHDMTVLRGVFGDPEEICFADVSAGGRKIIAVLEYPGQVRCTWEIATVRHQAGRWFDEEFAVYGDAQIITLQFPNPYVRYLPTTVRVRGLDGTLTVDKTIVASYDESFRREWRHFYDCITAGVPPRTGVEDGLRDVELLRDIVLKASE